MTGLTGLTGLKGVTLEDLFGDNDNNQNNKPGRLAEVLPGYSFRPQQWGAAKAFQEGFETGRHTLVEAPCGCGKGLAYLLPAALQIAEGKTVVVSTHTIALQEQLARKDVPALLALLPDVDIRFRALKGKGHYLCRTDLSAVAGDLLRMTGPDGESLQRIAAWAGTTETGDRADVPFPVTPDQWREVAAKRETCRGADCSLQKQGKCFYYQARDRAREANLVIVNHALLLEDLQVKRKSVNGGLLPHYDLLVIDEAHHLEGVAQEILGVAVRETQATSLCRRLRDTQRRCKAIGHIPHAGLLAEVEKANEALFQRFREGGPDTDFFFTDALDEEGSYYAKEMASSLIGLLEALVIELKEACEIAEIAKEETVKGPLTGCARLARALAEDLAVVVLTDAVNGDIRWVEVDPKGKLTLRLSPVEVGPRLKSLLWSAGPVCALTSATIATKKSGGFGFLKSRLGLAGFDTVERTLGSPFDFQKNALLYVPEHLPHPPKGYTDEYASLLLDEVERLLGLSGGRAFILCTSRRSLGLLRDRLEEVANNNGDYTVVAQGDAPFASLIRRFRESERAVLLGLASFWEGVDVQGDDLSLVIIDRIPFAVPDSPLTRAASEMITTRNGNWFRDYALPKAQIRLKQGFGRLIRTDTDRGIVAILDSRLANTWYGPEFLKSLPPARLARSWEETEAWGRKAWPGINRINRIQPVRQSAFEFN